MLVFQYAEIIPQCLCLLLP